jgi:NADPH-dependent 2,4-dienoyl-CoA reductase/sulfur reductase-like enzyme
LAAGAQRPTSPTAIKSVSVELTCRNISVSETTASGAESNLRVQDMDAETAPERLSPRTLTTRCCIVGGGPAGMMLGYLLGRAGVDTIVLEKHADFFRDFRGDTVHPSTLR